MKLWLVVLETTPPNGRRIIIESIHPASNAYAATLAFWETFSQVQHRIAVMQLDFTLKVKRK
jgi:hypothetical protein